MARTPHDPVKALLDQTPLTKALRADAWDAFHRAKTPAELPTHLDRLPLPKHVRAQLWDLKHRHTTRKDSQMGPRESKYGRGGKRMPDEQEPHRLEHGETAPGSVSVFIAEHFRHFNAATLHDAAEAYKAHLAKDGQILISIAGAFSTGELGRSLAPMIRAGKVHAVSCTGANLEESIMDLLGHDDYEHFPDYHEHTAEDDAALAARKVNRVTDVGVPESAMTPLEKAMRARLTQAVKDNDRLFPHEMLYDIITSKELEPHYQGDPEKCWLAAAAAQDLPIVVFGWADSTLGNVFAAECLDEKFEPTLVRGSIEYMMELADWYTEASATHPMGFVQCGGGISGDGPICVVPMLKQDAKRKDTPLWQYFVQLTDADESMGGYSGALPNEKASWGKLPPDAPMFNVKGDFSISFPLLAAYVMGW